MSVMDEILSRLERVEAENRDLRNQLASLAPTASVVADAAQAASIDGSMSRRAVIGAGVGAAAAALIGTVARPAPADAANGDSVILGVDNHATSRTLVASPTTAGLTGKSTSSYGLAGYSTSSIGVRGESDSSSGIFGTSETGHGVHGESRSDIGVYGTSRDAIAVVGISDEASGIYGRSFGRFGVQGVSDSGDGIYGHSETEVGVRGESESGDGVRGISSGARGGVFGGQRSQIRLLPATTTTHPGFGAKGDLYVDRSGRLWFCKGRTRWIQLA